MRIKRLDFDRLIDDGYSAKPEGLPETNVWDADVRDPIEP